MGEPRRRASNTKLGERRKLKDFLFTLEVIENWCQRKGNEQKAKQSWRASSAVERLPWAHGKVGDENRAQRKGLPATQSLLILILSS